MQRHKLQQREFSLYINFFTVTGSNIGTGLPERLQNPHLYRQSKLSWTQPWASWSKLALLWAHRWDHSIYSGAFQPKSCYNSEVQLWKSVMEMFPCIPLIQHCELLLTERSDADVEPQKVPHVFGFQEGPSTDVQAHSIACKKSNALNISFLQVSEPFLQSATQKRSSPQQGAIP